MIPGGKIPFLSCCLLLSPLADANGVEEAVLEYPRSFYTLGNQPTGVTVGYFNADDLIDIAVSNRSSHDLSIFMGEGGFEVSDPMLVPVGTTPRYVEAIDVDGDGRDELITTDYDDSTISMVRFDDPQSPVVTVIADLHRPAAFDVGDVDDDGDLDVVVVHWDEAAGTPSQAPGICTVLRNDGVTAGFHPIEVALIGEQPRCIRLADFDADGDLDALVCSLGSDEINILRNENATSWSSWIDIVVPDEPRFATAADFDSDGAMDFAVVHKSLNQLIVHLQILPGVFESQTPLATGLVPHGIIHGHIGADAHVDLVVADLGSHKLDIYANQGDGNFESSCQSLSPACPADVVAHDFDLDGWIDIVAAGALTDTVNIHRNVTGTETCIPIPCPSDIDGNEKVDVLDLLEVIGAWGECPPHGPPGSSCHEDLQNDGWVDVLDLLMVLDAWGECP